MNAGPVAQPSDPALSLYRLLDPEVLADPYPLYHRLRTEDPVHWDPFLHVWVVTRYADVIRVLHPPAHTRLRGLAAYAFTPARVEVLRAHIREITERLLDAVVPGGRMDVIADLAEPLPCIVTAEMLGVPVEDHRQLKAWSQDFAEMLGNFQHNPDHAGGRTWACAASERCPSPSGTRRERRRLGPMSSCRRSFRATRSGRSGSRRGDRRPARDGCRGSGRGG